MPQKKFLAAGASFALLSVSTMAVAQDAPPGELAAAAEQPSGSELRGDRWMIAVLPLLVVLALLYAVLNEEDDAAPQSP